MSHVVKRTERKPINFDMIVESTAEYFNLNPDAIFSQSRLRDIADARQMIMFLSHKHTQLSSPAIGAKQQETCHSASWHIVDKDRLQFSKELHDALEAIESELFK